MKKSSSSGFTESRDCRPAGGRAGEVRVYSLLNPLVYALSHVVALREGDEFRLVACDSSHRVLDKRYKTLRRARQAFSRHFRPVPEMGKVFNTWTAEYGASAKWLQGLLDKPLFYRDTELGRYKRLEIRRALNKIHYYQRKKNEWRKRLTALGGTGADIEEATDTIMVDPDLSRKLFLSLFSLQKAVEWRELDEKERAGLRELLGLLERPVYTASNEIFTGIFAQKLRGQVMEAVTKMAELLPMYTRIRPFYADLKKFYNLMIVFQRACGVREFPPSVGAPRFDSLIPFPGCSAVVPSAGDGEARA